MGLVDLIKKKLGYVAPSRDVFGPRVSPERQRKAYAQQEDPRQAFKQEFRRSIEQAPITGRIGQGIAAPFVNKVQSDVERRAQEVHQLVLKRARQTPDPVKRDKLFNLAKKVQAPNVLQEAAPQVADPNYYRNVGKDLLNVGSLAIPAIGIPGKIANANPLVRLAGSGLIRGVENAAFEGGKQAIDQKFDPKALLNAGLMGAVANTALSPKLSLKAGKQVVGDIVQSTKIDPTTGKLFAKPGFVKRPGVEVPQVKTPNTSLETVQKQINLVRPPVKAGGHWDTFKQQFLNRFDPIEQLSKGKNVKPSKDPATLLKRLSGGMGIANAKIDNELSPILKQVGNLDDFRSLLVAERLDEKSAQGLGKSAGNAVAELRAKVGDQQFTKYQQLAEGTRQFQGKLLQEWRDVGGLSDESYNAIVASNQKYTPLNRIVDDLETDGFVAGMSDLNQKSQVIKKFKGSDRDIIDPLESMLKNTYEMTKAIEKNRAISALAKLGEFEKIMPPMVPVARVERQGQIFPEVMDEVAKIVKQYGGNIERKLKTGNNFGYFESAAGDVSGNLDGTKLVTKFGTSKDTLLHEFGHLLDTKFGLRKNGFFDNVVSAELRAVADLRKGRQAYTRKGEEKIAEFVSMYFADNKNAKKVAPIATKKFDQFLLDKPELKTLFGKMKSRQRTAETTTETVFGQSQFEPKAPHITFFDKGKKVYYSAPKEIADAIKGINEEHLNLAVQAASIPARMMRAGATGLNVGFAVPNLIRDQLSSAVNSKYGGIPIYDFISGLASVLKQDDLYKRWLLSGADQASFFAQDRTRIQRTLGEVTGKKLDKGKYLNPLELARMVGEFSEKGSRVGTFKRAVKGAGKEGLTGFDQDLAAMVQSREATVDFARRGSKMKALNAMIPFLNARTQGSLKLIESFRQRPLQTGAIGTALATIPAATLYMHNRQYPEYSEIPDYIKDNNFIIMTGDKDTPFYKIPKGEVGQIFANPMENLLDYAYSQDRKSFTALAVQLLGGLSPIQNAGDAIPTAVKVPLESIANYDTFRKRNIVSPYQKDLPPELQFNKKTSETAKWIGQKLKISPAKIEHGIRGIGAGVAGQGLMASDYAAFGKTPAKQNLPVIDRFMGEQNDLSKTATKIYEEEDKRKQDVARSNYAIKQRIRKAIETDDVSLLQEAQAANPDNFKRFVNDILEDMAKQGLTPKERAIKSLPKKQQEALGLSLLPTTSQTGAQAAGGDVAAMLAQSGSGKVKPSTINRAEFNREKAIFKRDNNLKDTVELYKKRIDYLAQELDSPELNEAQKISTMAEIERISAQIKKYAMQGGFTKPKKGKATKKGKKGRKGRTLSFKAIKVPKVKSVKFRSSLPRTSVSAGVSKLPRAKSTSNQQLRAVRGRRIKIIK